MLKTSKELIVDVTLSLDKQVVKKLCFYLSKQRLNDLIEVTAKNGLNVFSLVFSVEDAEKLIHQSVVTFLYRKNR